MRRLLRAVAPALALLLPGLARAEGAAVVGGFYIDPNHHKPGTFAGTRMISDEKGDTPSDTITLVGSDDGKSFWSLAGTWTDKAQGKLSVDFSPKGGPSDLKGTCSEDKITWQDGNSWQRLGKPEAEDL
mmetsp:Transcript_79889/g.225933  ORF Transcript_79889/g.225933 Transcript_79889/m.225933 type:complete len:129 (-) Transcript_79889:111-497(-)